MVKKFNIYVIRILEGKRGENRTETSFEDLMAENFPKLKKSKYQCKHWYKPKEG